MDSRIRIRNTGRNYCKFSGAISSLFFLTILFTLFARILKAPRLGLPWVSEQWVFNELGFKIVIMPPFEPTWLFFWEIHGIFNLKAIGYLQKQCTKSNNLLRPDPDGSDFWFAIFFIRQIQKVKIFIGWVDTFLRTLFLCAGSPGILPMLSHTLFEQPFMHNCEFTIVYSLKLLWFLTSKILCDLCIFALVQVVFLWFHCLIFILLLYLLQFNPGPEYTTDFYLQSKKWWEAAWGAKARGKPECGSSYWLGARGACAFRGLN